MIHHDSDLFYEICNTINEHNEKQIHYLSSMFLTQFNIYQEVVEKALL